MQIAAPEGEDATTANIRISGERTIEVGRLAVASITNARAARPAGAEAALHVEAARAGYAGFRANLRVHALAVGALAASLDEETRAKSAAADQIGELVGAIRDRGEFPEAEEAIFGQVELSEAERAQVRVEATRGSTRHAGTPVGEVLADYARGLVELSRVRLGP